LIPYNVGSVDPSKLGGVQSNQKAREKGADMLIIGCDYHPAFQQCRAFLAHRRGFHDTLPTASTCSRAADLKMLCICGHRHRRLEHREGAEKFYRDLAAQGMKVRAGIYDLLRRGQPDERLCGIAASFS
jgi:hypothetical protein